MAKNVRASKAVRLSDTQNSAGAQNRIAEQTAEQTVAGTTAGGSAETVVKSDATAQATSTQVNPMVTVYDGGITEEIVHGYQKTKHNFLFSRNWGSYPLKDGRYVYEEWTGSGNNLHLKKKAYSGIRPDILAYLAKTDRKDNNSQRKNKEHADYSIRFEDGEEENDFYRPSAMDRVAFQQWLHKETWEAGEDDPIYPDELLKQDFVPGENKVNNQRWKMRRQVIEQFIPNLSRKDQDTVIKYYGMCMTEKEIGEEEGIGKQAICNRLKRVKDDLRKVFTALGIPFPTDEELEEERRKRKAELDAIKQAEKERRAYEREARLIRSYSYSEAMRESGMDRSMVDYDASTEEMDEASVDYDEASADYDEVSVDYGWGRNKKNRQESYDDYDPDNPYDSVSDDFDPYEFYDTYREEESEEDYWDEE